MAENTAWFRIKDPRGIFAYNPAPDAISIPVISDQLACTILDEYCKNGAELWDQEGTLTVFGMFSWLETEVTVDGHHKLGVKELIDDEWSMYLHHQHRISDASNLGWLQNIMYSITQQIMRQDLGQWLLYVATCLNHHPILISYLYYAKYVFKKDSGTAFQHIDLNINQFLATGRGANAI